MRKYFFLLWLGTGLWTACRSDFLETGPTDRLNQQIALSTQENIYAALNGIHRSMVAQYLSNQACGGEPSMCIIRDCLGEDMVHPNRNNTFYLGMLQWSDHRNATSLMNKYPFTFYYYLILQANLILEAVEQVEVTDSVQLRGIRGEALCFRAWAHFQLVQLYGQRYVAGRDNRQPGVPYRKSSSSLPLARHSVEECYRYIHEDLDQAVEDLQDYVPVEVTHFSLKVAYGLKARVFLVQQAYPEAADFAGRAIRKALAEGHRLMEGATCLNGFSRIISRTKEVLWGSHTLDDQSIAFFSYYAYLSWNFNSAAIRQTPRCINRNLYQQIAASDVRAEWWDASGTAAGPTATYLQAPYQNRKFKVENTTVSAGDFAYMRLAELYLLRAEALARSGQETEARQVLYELVATRDATYQLSLREGEDLCEEILLHRRIELWGEGFRFTDLKRLSLPLDRTQSNHLQSVCSVMEIQAEASDWQWLIPEEEIGASLGKVEQND